MFTISLSFSSITSIEGLLPHLKQFMLLF